MTMPSPDDQWDQDVQPADPETLPPGFYFAPGQGAKPQATGSSSAVKWSLVALAVVLIAAAIAVAMLVK